MAWPRHIVVHDHPGEDHRGAEDHERGEAGHGHGQVLPGDGDQAVELDDAEDVDEEGEDEEEAPGEHAEDPEGGEGGPIGGIQGGGPLGGVQRGHQAECEAAGQKGPGAHQGQRAGEVPRFQHDHGHGRSGYGPIQNL